jgi:excisionase family DNA binding protein
MTHRPTVAAMPTTHDPEQDLLSIGQAAECAGVSVRTIYRYEADGTLRPAQRTPGGHRRYRRADVEAIIERARRGPVAGNSDQNPVSPAPIHGGESESRERLDRIAADA